jgi:hypothetical protein
MGCSSWNVYITQVTATVHANEKKILRRQKKKTLTNANGACD